MKGVKILSKIEFTDEHASFSIKTPEDTSYLYFPLASAKGLKSAVTPSLGGDAKINQNSFLMEPVSAENLHNNRAVRNFWCFTDAGTFSVTGASALQESQKFTPNQDDSILEAGLMWHTLKRKSHATGLVSTVTSFIPVSDNVEIHHVLIENTNSVPRDLTVFGAIPIYGRSADNIRDHRHVTSLLHRITTSENGVYVCPTMSFDERGHQTNHRIYYVLGCTGSGESPVRFFPTVEDFIGEGGTFTHPRAVYENRQGYPAGCTAEGKEAMGAFAFPYICLMPGQTAEYILLFGTEENREDIDTLFQKYNSGEKVSHALAETKTYWQKEVNVTLHTGDPGFDGLMKWVSFQPILRRLFGCSFLPHHDYGRGGRGWRDLWQDCLSLLLMDPGNVGEMITKNFGGVRIDGTNATIIGDGDGNFIADRNGIARVWMDHALWPLITTKLYIDQTGDLDILYKEVPYFKDSQALRGNGIDDKWDAQSGSWQCSDDNSTYTGTILEHLLIQQLAAFYDIGDHNIYRLRGADWNDALDMAAENGESVAFTCAYAGNLKLLVNLLRQMEKQHPEESILLLKELEHLLCTDASVFDSIAAKKDILSQYTHLCQHTVSGEKKAFSPLELANDLEMKAEWLINHLRRQEWLQLSENEGWYNSYYDNHGQQAEGEINGQIRMMLTGQVFAIMGNVATDEQITQITRSADHYLYREEIGGYRLNTDFKELKFDMGRMFGFAYGEKENGAVFSHMTVMYANALYQRGYVQEGWKALSTLAKTALDFDKSHIYPGIPEYFRSDGRGMYHYLTGAASWFMLTMITEVFGVRGEAGDLVLRPKLLASQFDDNGMASIDLTFAGKPLTVTYENRHKKDFGNYTITSAVCGSALLSVEESHATLPHELLQTLSDTENHIHIILD